MKHPPRILISALLGLAALGLLALAAGSQEELISLSYLDEVFIPDTVERGVQETQRALEERYQSAVDALITEADPGSASFLPRDAARGDMLSLRAGSGFLLTAGVAEVAHDGAWIDVTAGAEVPSGSILTAGHRYLCAEDTSARVTVRSGLAHCAAEGRYTWQESGTPAAPFTDVAQPAWYTQAVDFAYFQGLFAGMGDETFAPSAQMDRAMMMTVLYHLAGSPEEQRVSAPPAFLDVPEERWYASFVNWAWQQGVSAGTGEQRFSPEQSVTREQVIVLLHNFALNHLGLTLEEQGDLSAFSDQDQIAFWAYDACAWAVGSGVTGGSAGTALEPGRTASRAEVASMLMNFSRRYLNPDLDTPILP